MTRRECVQVLAASPLIGLQEAYDHLQVQKKQFERRIGSVMATVEPDHTGKSFQVVLMGPDPYRSNTMVYVDAPGQKASITFSLEQAKELAAWIQAL